MDHHTKALGRTTRHLAGPGGQRVFNVRGGKQAWIGSADGPDGGPWDQWTTDSGETTGPPFRNSPWHEQLVPVVHFFGIKSTYTLLAGLLAIVLWRSKARDLTALRWAKIAFAAGIGPLGFGMLRVVLGVYHENMVWFNFWEETTELLFIGIVAAVLWIFRRGLFRPGQR